MVFNALDVSNSYSARSYVKNTNLWVEAFSISAHWYATSTRVHDKTMRIVIPRGACTLLSYVMLPSGVVAIISGVEALR